MSYVVVPSREVTRFLDKASTPTRDQYQQIVELLEEDPFPSADFPPISESTRPSGPRYLRYYDYVFPFAVTYRVFPPDATSGGLVLISRLDLVDESESQDE